MGNTYSENVSQNSTGFDIRNLEPKELFNLPDNFTWDELKNRYRQLALRVHPDKGGDRDTFNYVTQCFQKLSNELRLRTEGSMEHHELKNQFHKEQEEYKYTVNPNTFDNQNMFNDKFNQFFEENKFTDDEEDGYGDMMVKSDKNRDDIDIKNIFGTTNVNSVRFNETFEKKVPVSKEVIKYKDPEPTALRSGLSYALLGVKNNDYTGETETKNLQYTDYMRAYTEQRTPTDLNRQQFKSVKEYEHYRARHLHEPISSEEKDSSNAYHKKKEEEEAARLQNMRIKEKKISDYYSNISKMNIRL